MLIPSARDFYGHKPRIVSFRTTADGSLLLSITENEVGEGVAYLKSVCATLYFAAKGLGLISNVQPVWWVGMVGRYYPEISNVKCPLDYDDSRGNHELWCLRFRRSHRGREYL